MGRWIDAPMPPCHGIIAIARAFRGDPIEGMIAAGWLTDADLTNGSTRNAVRRAPTAALTEEIHQRALAGRIGNDGRVFGDGLRLRGRG